MQMTPADPGASQKEKLRNQVRALRSGNRTTVLDAIKEIRAESSISILGELFDLLLEQEDAEIVREISSLLNDLKLQEAAPVLAEAIQKAEYQSISTILVAACWQNGLSFGKYADTFVEVVIHGDYETGIEAFTVLEEAVGELDQEAKDKILKTIKYGILKADDRKKLLLRELIKVIEQY